MEKRGKNTSPALAIVTLAVLCSCVEKRSLSLVEWTKSPSNPVIKGEGTDDWKQWPGDPYVLKDGSRYKMWFGAHNEKTKLTHIGYAESSDGITWNVRPAPVLPVGAAGQYDAKDVETPTVIKDNDKYEMWYSATKGENEAGVYQIAHAVSSDGINWTKDGNNPVLTSGDVYGWRGLGILEPTVRKEDGVYTMWFSGLGISRSNPSVLKFQLGYATSTDGTHWHEHPENPILELGSHVPSAGTVMNSAFYVLKSDKQYELWYMGGDIRDVYATSPDGINWTKSEVTILPKGHAGAWDSWSVFGPTVMLENGVYKLWYAGGSITNGTLNFGIGYADGRAREL